MSSQVKRKIKGVTYVYEQTAHYDKEKKQTIRKQVLIGKLDEATGEIIPTRKKKNIINDVNNIKKEIIEKIEPLKEKDPEKYKEAVELVEKIPETPKKSEQTSSALGLYTANPLSVMFNGRATGALGQLKSAGDINPQRKTADVKGVKIISQNITEMGVGEAKIFRYALAAFTQKNSTGTRNSKLNLRMFLSFKDYAEATNTDISTEYNLKNFKKKLKKNLENLMEKHISFSWTENVRGKSRAYGGLSLISGYKIDNEAITVDFSLGFAEYLASLPTLVEYPRALYSVNDRNFNAFAIGEAMFLHYSINNNVIKGTEQMLSVQKLLEIASFPTYEEIKTKRLSWEQKVKERLEEALEHLHKCGFLKDWCYSQAKGQKLTNEEAAQITTYEKFASLYVWYEINDYPEHKERIETIIEAKAKNVEKNKRKKRNQKKE